MNAEKYLMCVFRYKTYKARQQSMKYQYLKKEDILRIQNQKFLKLIAQAKKHVPYYRDILQDIEIESIKDIGKIPFLTKPIVKKHITKIKAENIKEDDFKLDSTSGSTGESFYFYRDKKIIVAGVYGSRGDMMTGWKPGEPLVYLWGAKRDFALSLKKKLKRRFIYQSYMLSSFDLNEKKMNDYVKRINKIKPRLIIAYPTGITTLSEFINENKLKIHTPKGIVTSGETLYEYQRDMAETAFRTKVFNMISDN